MIPGTLKTSNDTRHTENKRYNFHACFFLVSWQSIFLLFLHHLLNARRRAGVDTPLNKGGEAQGRVVVEHLQQKGGLGARGLWGKGDERGGGGRRVNISTAFS